MRTTAAVGVLVALVLLSLTAAEHQSVGAQNNDDSHLEKLEIIDVQQQGGFPEYTIFFRARDQFNRDMLNIDQASIQIFEDDALVGRKPENLELRTTSEASPTVEVTLRCH